MDSRLTFRMKHPESEKSQDSSVHSDGHSATCSSPVTRSVSHNLTPSRSTLATPILEKIGRGLLATHSVYRSRCAAAEPSVVTSSIRGIKSLQLWVNSDSNDSPNRCNWS